MYKRQARTHSSYGNVDVLQAAYRQEVWINPLDAEKRGIKNGDMVHVFNQRGEVRLPAKVAPRIMPGVSAMGQGAWHDANMTGDRIDHGAVSYTHLSLISVNYHTRRSRLIKHGARGCNRRSDRIAQVTGGEEHGGRASLRACC